MAGNSRQSGRPGTRGRGRKPAAKKSAKVPGVLLLAAGIAIGVLITLLSRLIPNVDVSPDIASGQQAGNHDGGPKTHEPVFDFYTLLPESEVIAPVEDAPAKTTHKAAPSGSAKTSSAKTGSAKATPKPKPAATASSSKSESRQGGGFLLQAGSFRNSKDADRLRAQLILSGYDARIELVTVRGGERWHRVQLGPYASQKEVSKVRSTLAGMGLDTMLMRQR